MGFKLRSGNRPTFKLMGSSSTPFTKVDVENIKPDHFNEFIKVINGYTNIEINEEYIKNLVKK